MHSSIISLGTIGSFELIIVLGVLLLMAAGVVLVILTVLQILKSVQARSGSPSRPADGPAACPRCGTSVPADAPQGLCPRCVMQVGLGTEDGAEPAFKDASGKPNPPDPEELARHFPNLEVIGLLGQGGMGAVYKARQKDLDRLVALKVLPGGAGSDPAFAERFMREARALARLNHPGIVAVHDFGEVGGGTGLEPVSGVGEAAADGNTGRRPVPLYYFVMEFIDGPNLRELMHGQKLSPREAMSIVPKICEALQFAHDEGIVHRDIKPENILVDKKGRVKIADFGIAKIAGKGRDATLTGAKDVIGTPHYMAPEQIETPTEVDHRADIYSLGVVFYEMLTGELPLGKFDAPSRKVQVDVRLDEVVLHALEKEPERRYQHASEVRTDVETITTSAAKSEVRSSKSEVASAALSAIDVARRQVNGPAIGLLITGVVNWVLMPVALVIPPLLVKSIGESLPALMGIVFGLLPLLFGGFMIFAALKMRQLQYYAVAIMASVAAILFMPGNLIGLPIGIWALVVLLGKDVREAFGSVHSGVAPAPVSSGSSTVRTNGGSARGCFFIAGSVFLVGIMLIGLLMIGMLVASIALPALHRARDRARPVAAQHAQQPEPVPASQALRFAPVIERVVNDPDSRVGSEALDLDTGESLSYRADLKPEDLMPWIARQGGDLMGGRSTTWGVGTTTANELKLIHLASGDWESLAPNALGAKLDAGSGGVMVKEDKSNDRVKVFFLPKAPEFPITFGFQTRQGGRGILQLVGLTEQQHGIRVRYRLLQGQAIPESSAVLTKPVIPQVPPVVIRTLPEAGTSGVDPGLTEISVTFSKPMQDGNWSWVKLDEETFPELAGQPRFIDDSRTCVLPVKLQPGKTYATWINVDSFQNFQDRNGNPALPYLLVFTTKE